MIIQHNANVTVSESSHNTINSNNTFNTYNSYNYNKSKSNDTEYSIPLPPENQKYTYVSNLTYSPDGKSFAYIAQQDDKMFVVKDGVEGSKEYVILSKLTYSPDSRHFAYIQEQFDSHPHLSDGKGYVVAD